MRHVDSSKEHIEAIRTCWSLPHVCCIAAWPPKALCGHVYEQRAPRHVTHSHHIYLYSVIPPTYDRSCPAKLFQFNIVAARGVDCTHWLSDCQYPPSQYGAIWTLLLLGWRVDGFISGRIGRGAHLGGWLVLCAKLLARWHLLIWSTVDGLSHTLTGVRWGWKSFS